MSQVQDKIPDFVERETVIIETKSRKIISEGGPASISNIKNKLYLQQKLTIKVF